MKISPWLVSLVLAITTFCLNAQDSKHPLTLRDLMTFKSLVGAQISADGQWVVYEVKPDRGYSEVAVYNTTTKQTTLLRPGMNPTMTENGRWIAAAIQPDIPETEQRKKQGLPKPQTGMVLLDTDSGEHKAFPGVKSFRFSTNGQWLIYRLYADGNANDSYSGAEHAEQVERQWQARTFTLVLHHLASAKETCVRDVVYFALSPSDFLAYCIYGRNGNTNGLFARNLVAPEIKEVKIYAGHRTLYTGLSWSPVKNRLAFIFHRNGIEEKSGDDIPPGLHVWEAGRSIIHSAVPQGKIPSGWMIPADNRLVWSAGGNMLFFGFKPRGEYLRTAPLKKDTSPATNNHLHIPLRILRDRSLEVWHWKDRLIVPQQEKQWELQRKQIYYAVYHFGKKTVVPLADPLMPRLQIPKNAHPRKALAFSEIPYLDQRSWNHRYHDVYLCDLTNGFRVTLLKQQRRSDSVILSPTGKYVVYFRGGHWFLYNVAKKNTRRLTLGIATPFADTEHDLPGDAPDFGIAGWTPNDGSVIIYDRYDAWEFFTASRQSHCLTGGEGRKNRLVFRIHSTSNTEPKIVRKNQKLLLTAFSEIEKFTAFYRLIPGQPGVQKLLQKPKTFRFLAKAANANKVIYTEESYNQFPDIRLSDADFKDPVKISRINPKLKGFNWGSAHLLEWKSLEGQPLQGLVIKPENFNENRRYPVLVYLYHRFSSKLREFPRVAVSDFPCMPYYAGQDYVLFLPDIRFRVGAPGQSAYNSVVPGIKKLLDNGTADHRAIAVYGHSWGGYLTAYLLTRTRLFAAAIAGAPVANLTSAYNAIRWRSGIPRQFHYESAQGRMGKTPWEFPEGYIANSPVMAADKITTPLLIQVGDIDGTVPWSQAIELYLALRRLKKNCILLRYTGEPHHLQKYPNKLDYTIKTNEFLDRYLKQKPVPAWIANGIYYSKNN